MSRLQHFLHPVLHPVFHPVPGLPAHTQPGAGQPARRWRAAARASLATLVAMTAVLTGCGGGGNGDAGALAAEAMSTAATAQAQAPDGAAVQTLSAAQSVAQSVAPVSTPSVTALRKVAERRTGRTTFEYDFRITVRNGSSAQTGLKAQITGAGPGTTVLDGVVLVGNLAADATATPTDTITLRLDRRVAFHPALLVWQFSQASPVPASLTLDVAQRVVGAGTPLALLPGALDAAGTPITPPPALGYQIVLPASGSSGTVPSVVNGQVVTGADTRGSFDVRASLAGTALQASAHFTVIQGGAQSANAGLYSTLSAAQSTVQRQLKLAADAQQRGDAAALAAAAAAIASAGASVDLVKMSYSTAYAPDLGFVPLATKLDANGIHAVAADAGYGSATAQLRSKLAQLTQFLNQAPGTDAADSAALVQFQVELAAIASTLRSPAARPSVYGVVQHGDAISDLLAKDMPLLLKALAARTQAQASLPPSAGKAAAGSARPAAAAGAGSRPDGVTTTVISKLGPIGELVVAIYGDYLDQLENMIIIMLINHLLDAHLPQSISIHGVLSGAALLGPYAYHYPNSYIDMDGLSLAAAQNADVYLIGGAAVNAVREAIAQRPAGGEITIQGIYDLLDRIATILSTAYQAAHQQPAYVITNSFSENFGCLPSLSDFCIEMHYPNGFENVSGGSVSFTVLMLIRSNGPQPQYGIKLLSFAPGT